MNGCPVRVGRTVDCCLVPLVDQTLGLCYSCSTVARLCFDIHCTPVSFWAVRWHIKRRVEVVDLQSGGSMLFVPLLYAIVARYQRLIVCSAVARLFIDFLCASIVVEKWRIVVSEFSDMSVSGVSGSGPVEPGSGILMAIDMC